MRERGAPRGIVSAGASLLRSPGLHGRAKRGLNGAREGAPHKAPRRRARGPGHMDDAPKAGLAGALADGRTARVTPEEALALHAEGRPGKLEIRLTKPLITARDLSLAYSPGVA